MMIWFAVFCISCLCAAGVNGYPQKDANLVARSFSERDVGSQVLLNATSSQVRHPEKRLISGILTFVGQHIARYILNKGFAKIEHAIFGNNPNDKIQEELKKIQNSLKDIEKKMTEIGSNVVSILLEESYGHFARKIASLELIVHERSAMFLKGESERTDFEKQIMKGALAEIFDDTYGIKGALRDLHNTILGESTYEGTSLIETHYKKVMYGKKMSSFKTDAALRDNIASFIQYLFEMQEAGFAVWYLAKQAQYKGQATLMEHLNDVNSTYEKRLIAQKEKLDVLFANCEPLQMPKATYKKTPLDCSDGTQFGSICKQTCSGGCWTQKAKYTDYMYYPPQGYEPLQCLLNGKWSTNRGNEVKTGCSFCMEVKKDETKFLRYPSSCYLDSDKSSCSVIALPEHTKGGKKCHGKCVSKKRQRHPVEHFDYWCYTDKNESDWDYCAPTKIYRDEYNCKGDTPTGKKCKGDCLEDRKGYFYCYHQRGGSTWEYSN